MVTEAVALVGGVQLPKLPNLVVAWPSTDVNDAVVVTVMYVFRTALPVQVVLHETAVPGADEHSQNTELLAVTPVRPVAFCAVVEMLAVSVGAMMPYWAPSRAP